VVGPRLAIVIPSYREGSSIGPLVKGARKFGAVIVIDDCSHDETAAVAEANGATVFVNKQNCGYDGALSRGFAEAANAGFTHVVTMDADGEHSPDNLAAFREYLINERTPLVLGFRARKQRLSESIMGAIVRRRFGVLDILCGMKGYDLALWRANRGFDHCGGIGTELALSALKRGTAFRQVAVVGVPREDAPRFGRGLKANFRIFSGLCRSLRRPVLEHIQLEDL